MSTNKKPFTALSRFLRELKAFYSFFHKLPRRKREIVFYSEDIASWSYFEGFIEHLCNDLGLNVCYITSDANDPRLKETRNNFNALYINKLLFLFVLILDSKLLIMTMPDLHQFHIRRSERGAHHVYMFHNIGSSFPVIRFGAIFHYDTVFCVGPHHREEIRAQEKLYGLKEKNLVDFGYYRLEHVYEDYRAYMDKRERPAPGSRARVLLAPSWGDDSILNVCGKELVGILLDGGYEVIVRPHPMTRKKTPEVIEDINKEYGHRENYIYEGDISSSESFYTTDILISDWSGVTYEYAFGTERPVLFVDVPRKIMNPRHSEVGIEPMDVGIRHRIGKVVRPDELHAAVEAIDHLIANKDAYVEEIRRAREQYVYNFGESSRAGAAFIKGFLEGKAGHGAG